MAEYMDRSIALAEFTPESDDPVVICRCEEITKGEIRKAVHAGMMTLPEVKRYLRAGMGLCQGQTCGRMVKSIVEKELNMRIAPQDENTVRAPLRPVDMKVYGNEVVK